mmetsp:Transcript_29533/g.26108  ORF Transcript_29533/g.26108 Transcript_29533/m.26108 type:complete len:185 (+) Transcript_29533:95-649(+)|eukprot:CAMPEP_0201579022 /NCGR_PEP_ID=MMETSP0190_2-20130828/26233_1 /ASSEMBLY_ACC=CAM_ASM_000263 /TAXON_ID=37353 /ORGANISM="Rosalina sp." /LENGTH=184 /DNA_ID=CAMNT_0048012859 /DNA_START=90 /DNA_END=644 /DNA_ORIENTATION=-
MLKIGSILLLVFGAVYGRSFGTNGPIIRKFQGSTFGLRASEVTVTVANCTKNTDEGKINSITLNPPSPEKVNSNFTIEGTGSATVAIDDATYNAVAKVKGIPVFTQNGDLCKPAVIQLPGGVGTIYFAGVKCPVAANSELKVTIVADVSSSAPDDVKVDISITAKDTKTKNEIVCISATADGSG